jgi:hypothetical protein
MMSMRLQIFFLIAVTLLHALPLAAEDDASTQLWLSIVLGHQPSDKLYLEVENQPKAQVAGGERWGNFDATWLVEYYPNAWFDLTAELVTGYTVHTETDNSFEITPRPGLRVHFVAQTLQKYRLGKSRILERLSGGRYSVASWFRIEERNFFYSGDTPNSHEWRFRIRPEFKVAFNNPSLTEDGTFYAHGDVEFFIPLSDDIPERFPTKIRFRLGPGYRHNERFKMELMFMLDKNRDSPLGDYEDECYMADLRLMFLF